MKAILRLVRLLKIVIALFIFLPTIFIAFPMVLYISVNYGDGTTTSKALQEKMMRESWTLRPFLWVHATLFCDGDYSRQKF